MFAILCALPLVAADPASILGVPAVLVYPFTVNGSAVAREAGSRLAVTIATQMAMLGGVNVKPAPPGVERQAYLEAAHHEGVDYYIAGYVTPLGDGVSLVEQLVSAQTGIVVYSNTAQVRTYEDAAGQGDVLREALLRHQTRNLGAYAAPPPIATPSPAPGPNTGKQANIGRLFGRKQKRTNQPAPSPKLSSTAAALSASRPPARATDAAPAPAPAATSAAIAASAPRGNAGYGMLGIGGSAATDRRIFTVAAIRNVMIAKHQRVATVQGSAPTACTNANVGTLLGGNLSTRNRTILGQPQTTATLELLAYDCAGSVVYRKTFARDTRGDWKTAVDRVVQSAVAEFLRDPAGSRHS